MAEPCEHNMDNISILAASGMRARMESLDLLANNLANAETGGFKADREFYSIYVSAEASADATSNGVATLPVVEKQWTDLSSGDLRPTWNQLDLAVDGEGLFEVQTARGVRYTRNGSLRLSSTGTLTTADGSSLRSDKGLPIVLDPSLKVEVLPDGTVQQAGNPIAKLQISSFAAGSLVKEGANYFVASVGATPTPPQERCCKASWSNPTWVPRSPRFAWFRSCGSSRCCKRRPVSATISTSRPLSR